MFLGSLIVWSLADRAEQVEQVPAAVVNLDQPVLKKGQPPIAGGRLLSAGLTQPQSERQRSLGWEITSAEDARSGLREGEYYAVLTIPESFSRQLDRSLRGKDPRQAEITVQSNDKSSALVAQVSDQVAQVAADKLGEEVTTLYLDSCTPRPASWAASSATPPTAPPAWRRAPRSSPAAPRSSPAGCSAWPSAPTGSPRQAKARRRCRPARRTDQAKLAGGADRLAEGLATLSAPHRPAAPARPTGSPTGPASSATAWCRTPS